MMKHIVMGLALITLTGCTSDVSNTAPHNKLLNTLWELKMDAYVVENFDSKGVYRIIPCAEENYVYFPNWDWEYNEDNIGKKGRSERIIAGLKQGTQVKVIRVMKDLNPEIGTRYYPMAIPLNDIDKIGQCELNAQLLYRGFHDQGLLNPEYVKKLK